MVYGCGNKCVKYLVFLFNFLVFVVGVVILGVSLGARFSNAFQADLTKILGEAGSAAQVGNLYIPLYILMGVGSLLILTGFLGCCGACTENSCLLTVFFAIVLILFIAELGCGIAILVKKDDFKNSLFDAITASYKDYNKWKQPQKDDVKGMQKELQCCGCQGFTDFPDPAAVADSCGTQFLQIGCCEKIWNKAAGQLAIVGGVAIGILVIELLAMIFSCILCQAFKRGDYHYA